MKDVSLLYEAKLSGACLDYYSSWGPELKALWISLAKLSDWHRMDECSLRQSSVAGYQSLLINGPLCWKQMPPSFTTDLDGAAKGHQHPIGLARSPPIKIHLLAIF